MTEHALKLAHDFGVVLLADDELELQMYGRIGDSLFEEGITAKLIGESLAKAPKNLKTLRVKLSSPGGNAADGMAIRSMLAAHPARVTMNIEGLAASAASVIAMAGDTIKMHEGAALMLHEGRTYAEGNAAEFQRKLAALEAINDGAATVYAARSGKSKDEIRQLMAAETWLTPEQALEQKFIDEIVRAKKPPAATMYFDLGGYGYEHIPATVAALYSTSANPLLAHAATGGSPRTRDDIMSYARIAIALGLAESADENTILQRIDQHKTLHARDRAAVAELLELTGKPDATAALGVARAFAQDHGKVAELEKQLAARDTLLENQERAAILRADQLDPKGHKLTPATIKFWETQPVAMLKAFMESASYVVTNVTPLKQPQGAPPAPDGTGVTQSTLTPTHAAAGGGAQKTAYAQLSSMERHQLKRQDPERFRALRLEAQQAGEI